MYWNSRIQADKIYLMRKMKAWMQKGVVIHDAVKAAQRGWSSFDKSKKVAKSVETSDRPRITLKKINLQSASILHGFYHHLSAKRFTWL